MENKNLIIDGDDVEIKNGVVTKSGVCPSCGHEILVYRPFEFCDDAGYYGYECKRCLFEGMEWYDLRFSGHSAEGGQNIV